MAGWLIFAARRDDDAALWNSHWIAQESARLAPVKARWIERDAAVREALEEALGDEAIAGIALFGHGRPHAVMGADRREALDAANIHLVGARWVHAFACLTGLELVPGLATHAGLFVGYDVALIVEWSLEDLPDELRARISAMVTATTLALLDGVRDKAQLQRRVANLADDVSAWLCDNTEEGYLGLHILAQQLVERMVVSR